MSIDLSGLPTKTDFDTANPEPIVNAPTEQEIYNTRKAGLENRITRFFSRNNIHGAKDIDVRVNFLTPEDKAALIVAIEAKGYACVEEEDGIMKIN